MGNLIDYIYSRSIVQNYCNKKVESQKIMLLLEAAMAAPSACSNDPWEFIVISEEEKSKELKEKTKFKCCNAPLSIVVCGNTKLGKVDIENTLLQDCSAAIQNIVLACAGIDLAAEWCIIYPSYEKIESIKEMLHIPEHVIPLGIVCVGYPNETKSLKAKYNEKALCVFMGR
ncbi:MAG TPA: nitroreductase family protein, partial [Clostridium sp.]|nr:nitroreductase family protein [Clostridium sp.]